MFRHNFNTNSISLEQNNSLQWKVILEEFCDTNLFFTNQYFTSVSISFDHRVLLEQFIIVDTAAEGNIDSSYDEDSYNYSCEKLL